MPPWQLLLTFCVVLPAVYGLKYLVAQLAGGVNASLKRREQTQLKDEVASVERFLRRIDSLSAVEARENVDALLDREHEFLSSEPLPVPESVWKLMGPVSREFFSRFGSIADIGEQIQISAAALRPADPPAFVSIGGTEDGSIFLSSGSDVVYELNPFGTGYQPVAQTLYHWLLMQHHMFYGDGA